MKSLRVVRVRVRIRVMVRGDVLESGIRSVYVTAGKSNT